MARKVDKLKFNVKVGSKRNTEDSYNLSGELGEGATVGDNSTFSIFLVDLDGGASKLVEFVIDEVRGLELYVKDGELHGNYPVFASGKRMNQVINIKFDLKVSIGTELFHDGLPHTPALIGGNDTRGNDAFVDCVAADFQDKVKGESEHVFVTFKPIDQMTGRLSFISRDKKKRLKKVDGLCHSKTGIPVWGSDFRNTLNDC